MGEPGQVPLGVYLNETGRLEPIRGDLGGQMDIFRAQGASEPIGRDFREGNRREGLRGDAAVTGAATPGPGSPEPGRESTNPQGLGRDSAGRVIGAPLPGTPLPAGNSLNQGQDPQSYRGAPPPGRALTNTPGPPEDSTAMQRAMGILKQAAPFVARLLPLIDGPVTTAVNNLLAPRQSVQAAPVDLTPVQTQIGDLQVQHNELRGTVQEQTTALKRVEDRLEMVREATDRNTLEQQELMQDLKGMGRKVSLVATGVSILLVLSVLMNVILYLYIKRVLP